MSPSGGLASLHNAASSVKELNILIALVRLFTSVSFASPYLLTADNVLGVSRLSLKEIAAIGQIVSSTISKPD